MLRKSPGFALTAIAVLALGIGAKLLPAWRAIRVNPMVALRYE